MEAELYNIILDWIGEDRVEDEIIRASVPLLVSNIVNYIKMIMTHTKTNMTTQHEREDWEKFRNKLVADIHRLVSGEVQRTYELQIGVVRRDGGRELNEQSSIQSMIKFIHDYIGNILQSHNEALVAEIEGMKYREHQYDYQGTHTIIACRKFNEALDQAITRIKQSLY